MSFYSDSTIADLRTILALASFSGDPWATLDRFRTGTGDADLAQVLINLYNDSDGATEAITGAPRAYAAQVRSADALQGIEDQDQAIVNLSTDSTGDTLTVTTAGNTIEI